MNRHAIGGPLQDHALLRLRVRGRVDEAMFKFADWELYTEVATDPGSDKLRVHDVVRRRLHLVRGGGALRVREPLEEEETAGKESGW